jgi:type IV pilus assembly protein PilC
MPLLRSLHLLSEQVENRRLKTVIGQLEAEIENGSSLAESLKAHPKVFDRLYVSMVKAGELSGALELSLKRLAEFMEKAQKIKGKVKAALFYPSAVLLVAVGIMTLLMVYVLPKFKMVFDGLMNGAQMPAFTVFVFNLSEFIKNHFLSTAFLVGVLTAACVGVVRTRRGTFLFDWLKLKLPLLGPVFRKAAIGRFARTMATLSGSGVPILQALTIVKETAGNVLIANVVSQIHENVKQGEPIAPTLKISGVFPLIISGMVDVGEQTGALPDMLMKIADNCDEEVENAANAMTSLMEPILIVFLAVIVGSIVIAMFLPILRIMDGSDGGGVELKM